MRLIILNITRQGKQCWIAESRPLDKAVVGTDIVQEDDEIDVVNEEDVFDKEDEGELKYEGEEKRVRTT